MRGTLTIPISDVNRLSNQLCRWSHKERFALVLNSNSHVASNELYARFSRYQVLAAFGAEQLVSPLQAHFSELQGALEQPDWLFGFLGYDLKNELERLSSSNPDGVHLPDMLFFVPSIVFAVQNNLLTIHYTKGKYNRQSVASLYDAILAEPRVKGENDPNIRPKARFSMQEYTDAVLNVKRHIQRGDIYEMNLCQEFFASHCRINPYETFINLNTISPTPFAAFGRFNDKFLLCASPERYLQKQGSLIVTQPIKGTCPRGRSEEEDRYLVEMLRTDPKERSENIMIVDLVRNDLSRIAERGTVRVDELCGIYPFRQVNQMISTVSCQLRPNLSAIEAIRATFPMGSMTGAPKVSAMQIIEEHERTKRGLFSGAVGYFDPQGDFDFNVVIRSMLFNKTKRYLSFSVGGAITNGSQPEREYNECLLKAKAINQVLSNEKTI